VSAGRKLSNTKIILHFTVSRVLERPSIDILLSLLAKAKFQKFYFKTKSYKIPTVSQNLLLREADHQAISLQIRVEK
jgi:hypothetical protein